MGRQTYRQAIVRQGVITFCIYVHAQSCHTLCNSITVAHQAPLSVGSSGQEYWSGWSFPSPGGLPDPGIETTSLVSPASTGGFFTTSATWEAQLLKKNIYIYIRSVAQSCPTLCDPMNRSTPGLPVHHQLPEFTQTHIH